MEETRQPAAVMFTLTRILTCLSAPVLWLALVMAAPLASASETLDLGGLKVEYWAAEQAKDKPPVIIFSHGFGGCAVQSSFLMKMLAAEGYAVFAPDHADASCNKEGRGTGGGEPVAPFGQPKKWSEDTYRSRGDDVRRLLTVLRSTGDYQERIDLSRIGLVGHSLGGYTMLGLAGAWPSWTMNDPSIKAVLALSPYSSPYVVRGNIANVHVPVMYQGGTRDPGVTPVVSRKGGAYDQSHAPKYFVEFEGAGHFAWTQISSEFHLLIDQYSLAFLDQYVKAGAAAVPVKVAGVSDLRYLTASGERVGLAVERKGAIRDRIEQRINERGQ